MPEQVKCEWCGNTSGLTDQRGNCISCGASFREKEQNYFPPHAGGVPQSRIARWDGTAWNVLLGDLVVNELIVGNSFLEQIYAPDPNNFGRDILIGVIRKGD